MTELNRRCFLSVRAEADPTVPARILGLLTVRGELPQSFSARKAPGDELLVEIELADADPRAVSLLARRLENNASVLDVATTWLVQRRAA